MRTPLDVPDWPERQVSVASSSCTPAGPIAGLPSEPCRVEPDTP